MDRRAFVVGIAFLTVGCITDGATGTDSISRQNLTESRDSNTDSGQQDDLPKAVFDPEKDEVTITTVLKVEACNEAFIKSRCMIRVRRHSPSHSAMNVVKTCLRVRDVLVL